MLCRSFKSRRRLAISNNVFIGSHVPSDLASAVQERAKQSDRSVSSVVRIALRGWLATPVQSEPAEARQEPAHV